MSEPAVKVHSVAVADASLGEAVEEGLAREPRAIPPKFFYDRRGSELFDAICRQPEYYPTRTETAILERHAGEIAAHCGTDCRLVEFGSGASRKIRILLDALQPASYTGLDISGDFLLDSTRRLAVDHPWLEVHALCADFTRPFHLPEARGQGRLAFFPGSSIGNFEPVEARALLSRIAGELGTGGRLLIGVDRKKDPAILDAAYNDARGLTAAFNRNLLERMRRELDAEIETMGFAHRAFYNRDAGRVEMHLEARSPQAIRLGHRAFAFAPGETIHTENSYKYTPAEFESLAGAAGFEPDGFWTDSRGLFGVHLLRVSA